MHAFRIAGLATAVIVASLVSGCATMAVTGSADVDKNSFGPHKRFAVVSIASFKTFRGEQGLGQMFTNNDDIPGVNTQPIINKLRPRIIGALEKTRHFSLLPEDVVLRSKAYRSLAEDERVMKVLFVSDAINVAPNYKYFSDEQKFAKLAKDLNVDGVIGIVMNFSITTGGGHLSVGGISLGKKSYSATAGVTAIAYNRKGQVIWKDSTMKEADPDDSKAIILIDTSSISGTNFEKLHPSAVEIGGKAVDVLLARLDDTIAGREVSSVQSVK